MLPTVALQAFTATSAGRHIEDAWPVKDIVYVSIVGTVMLAALLEWVLWLLAFLYCLCKVFQKAEGQLRWSVRILAILNMIVFFALRCIFLPIMVVTLPLPSRIVRYFPERMVSILQLFAFWAFAGLLTIPWLFCVYQLITHNIGRTRRVKTVLDEYSAPKVVIIMPCYNEEPDVLLRTVDSIVDCEYPPSCMHIFLSFDGDKENELYLNTIEKLGVPLTLETYPKSIDVQYRSCRITVSRFPHGGKRSCQKKTFKLIDRVYAEYLRRNDNLFLLFIDSDCILDRVCIQNFMYEMDLRPGSKRNMLAMTGVITSTTTKNSLITLLQDMEYIHGQLFERSVESGCGAVTCLPGALTMLRFSAFRKMAKYYFADKAEQCNDLFDYGKCHLGEDRWLTHLFMIGAKERYQIQMNTGAFCKTEAVQTFKSLLKQRRRWFLGFITNEVCMLTDYRLWKRYPLLLIIRLAQNTIRTTALLFFIMVISVITTNQKITNLPVGFIAVSLGLNWALMIFFALKLGRLKAAMYPLMFVLNPFMNWLYMVYGIFTAGQRTWGGPRADAGKADEHTTPAQVIEHAEQNGDELNVVPETFRPALGAATQDVPQRTPLLPFSDVEGRFTPAEELPGGWYQQVNHSGPLLHKRSPWAHGDEPYPRHRFARDSFDSTHSDGSVYRPKPVESIFDDPKDARIYLRGRASQRPPGGAHFETRIAQMANTPYEQPNAIGSYSPAASDSSLSLHFDVPYREPAQPAFQTYAGTKDPQPYRNGPSDPLLDPQVNDVPAAPLPVHNASLRPPTRHENSETRLGKSPLARKSFTRLASPPPANNEPMNAAEVIELERLVAARSLQETERRGRSRDDWRRRPRKLSKQRRASSSTSRR
ncbi:glycosyltransferase family 2 protein [Baudoinia panamericana UAMH 10762]|uniref:chitin synthase n=1 Tax=Baudoinia panamericana (strain UAMH 10762) TaxID=717646 RepID=M2LPP0_BAUPA|nr:glycosyltransferase family 2 protein [Baudoinia panamericana UAMH 10762]EMC96372.1 glycosyltransferase family 2 protein [Baudoinia panamericana UAMH 10762]